MRGDDGDYHRRRADDAIERRIDRLSNKVDALDNRVDVLSIRVAIGSAIISGVILVASIIGPVIAKAIIGLP